MDLTSDSNVQAALDRLMLATRIELYLRQLAPHVRAREAARLLEEAHAEIVRLRAEADARHVRDLAQPMKAK